MSKLGEVSYEVSEVGELGEVSFGMLEWGQVKSFGTNIEVRNCVG